jgi:hypothetical protein
MVFLPENIALIQIKATVEAPASFEIPDTAASTSGDHHGAS